MSNTLKKPLALLLALLMLLGTFIPNVATEVLAADGNATYAQAWPMTGAQYTAYTSRNAAQTALNNMKNGQPAGTTGIAKTTSNANAVFTIGTNNQSQTLELPVNTNGNPYYVVETKVPAGWDLDETIHEMKVVPNGQAIDVTNGLVKSKELPDYFKLQVQKNVSMQTSIDTAAQYMAKYPLTGAKFIATTDKAYAESLIATIKSLAKSKDYPKTISYDNSKVATDMQGQKAIFTTNASGLTNERWMDEDITYYIVEVERPNGYMFSEDIVTTNASPNLGNTTFTATQTEKEALAWIRLDKSWARDAFVQEINPNEYDLEITWTIYKSDMRSIVATGRTNDVTGKMIWSDNYLDGQPAVKVPLGQYFVEETAVAPNSGKIWKRQLTPVNLSADGSINELSETHFKNNPIDDRPTINLIFKTESPDENQENVLKIQGTQFKMYYIPDSTLDPSTFYTTDSEGRKVLTDEIKAQATHDWTFEFKDNDNITSKTEEMWVIDEETNEPVLRDVTNFYRTNAIFYEDKYLVSGSLWKDELSGREFTIVGTYLFEEVKSTRGFALSEPTYWQLKNNGDNTQFVETDIRTYDMNSQPVVAEPKQGVKLIIQKDPAEPIDEDTINTSMAGAKFRIEKYDDATGLWQKAMPINKDAANGDTEYIITTDENGYAETYRMLPGKFRMVEIEQPKGYTLERVIYGGEEKGNGEPFDLQANTQNNGEYTFYFTTEVKNVSTKQPILKVSYNDESNLAPLAGATLQLIDLADDNKVLKEWVTTEEAKIWKGLEVGKTYRITEVGVPEGYLMPMGEEAYVDVTIEDKEQQIEVQFLNEKIPQLRSYAIMSTGLKEQLDGVDVVLNDHYWAEDLLPNKTYTFKNVQLRNADDESVVATAEDIEFTTTSVTAEFDVVFEFNTSGLEGGKYVVTGELHRNDRPITTQVKVHYDLADFDESIVVPKIGTYAFDSEKAEASEADKFVMNDVDGTVKDRVDYEKLLPNIEYIVVAKLVDENETVVSNVKTTFTTPGSDEPTVDGSVYVDIPVESTKYNGHTLTVYEYVYRANPDGEEVLIAKHEDISDDTQQVQIPEVITAAHEVVVVNEDNEEDYWFELTDRVWYNHVPANATLIGTATVMDPETKEPLVDENGNTFTAETTIETDISGEGFYEVTINIPYSLVEGKDIVMFEGIKTESGIDIAHHYEWEDQDQTVEFPEIHTTAWAINKKESDPGYSYRTKNIPYDIDTLDVVDIVNVSNVKAGETYTLVGKVELVFENGEVMLLSQNPGETHIVAEDADNYELTMDFKNVIVADARAEGSKIVVTEELYKDYMLVGKHYQLADENQTLRKPKIGTTASDKADGDKYIYNNGEQKIIDVVKYSDLMPNVEVELKTWLVDFEGNDILDANGNKVEFVQKFTPTELSGEIEVELTVDGKYFEGQTLTVFEDVYEGSQLVAMHHDLSQESQTVYVPEVKTHGSYVSEVMLDDDNKAVINITDILEYKNVPVEELMGRITLIDLATKAPLTNTKGEVITTEYTFTPTETEGEFQVTVTVPVEEIREKKFNIYEELFRLVLDEDDNLKEVPLAEHKDLEDTEQIVRLPEVETTALDYDTQEHVGYTNDGYEIVVDTVKLTDVKPNHTYVLKAKLANVAESTDEEVKFIDIPEVEVEFTTPNSDEKCIDEHFVEVEIQVPSKLLKNKTVVAFESLFDEGVELAIHADINDENQTVEYVEPKIGTVAELANTEEDLKTGMTTIKDTVSYENLKPGREYTLEAKAYNPETKEFAKDQDGNEYAFTKTFTPKEANGEEVVELNMKQIDVNGNILVVYEKLFIEYGTEEQFEITNHEDPTDKAQTVQLPLEVKVEIHKMSAGIKQYALKGAKIAIFNDKDEMITDKFGNPAEGVTDENGVVTFSIFTDRETNYYAKEIEAPKGYHINNDKFALERDENGVLSAAINIEILDNIIIISPPPKTGDNMNIYLWLSLFGVAIVGVGTALFIKKRKA